MIAAIVLAALNATIGVDGHERHYRLHVPPALRGAVPLVIAFHGGTSTPEKMEETSSFSALADREQFIVAYPEAIEGHWNDGRGTTRSAKMGIDDVAFTRAVIRDIQKNHKIDPSRIYATGPSNGGILSNRLGCEMADTLAAIGPVIGTLASNLVSTCRPAAPVAVVGVLGLSDPLVPFEGGVVRGTARGEVQGGRATEAFWAKANGCNGQPSVIALPSKIADGTSVARRSYSGCRAGADVVWYEISGGGHRWPPQHLQRPAAERLALRTLGKSSQNIDATAVLWDFFKAHPKR